MQTKTKKKQKQNPMHMCIYTQSKEKIHNNDGPPRKTDHICKDSQTGTYQSAHTRAHTHTHAHTHTYVPKENEQGKGSKWRKTIQNNWVLQSGQVDHISSWHQPFDDTDTDSFMTAWHWQLDTKNLSLTSWHCDWQLDTKSLSLTSWHWQLDTKSLSLTLSLTAWHCDWQLDTRS